MESRYKIAFIGDSGVGKTSIIEKYRSDIDENYKGGDIQSTIGAAYFKFELNIDEKTVILEVWDTAGQEKYSPLLPNYTRGSALLVIVIDMSSETSFNNIEKWNNYRYDQAPGCPFILVGNKIDLEPEVSKQEVESWAKEKDIQVFFTSAKTDENIVSLFSSIAEIVSKSKENELVHDGEKNIDLNQQSSKKSCC